MDPIPKAPILDMPRATFQRKFPDHGTAAEVDSRELQGFSLFGVCSVVFVVLGRGGFSGLRDLGVCAFGLEQFRWSLLSFPDLPKSLN